MPLWLLFRFGDGRGRGRGEVVVLWSGGLVVGGRFARSGAVLVDFCFCAGVGVGRRPIDMELFWRRCRSKGKIL